MGTYVIITPAHNEEAFIEKTVRAVTRQTVKPLRWFVVNDGSTDSTAGIIERYMPGNPFIELIDAPRPAGRHFGNKVHAFNRGLAGARRFDYDYIGNLDADVSFAPDYFEKVLAAFDADRRLGIAGGTVFSAIDGAFVGQDVSPDSVAGAVQLFRRECFDQVGGYVPLPNGGIDAAAEIMARMHGWMVRTLPDLRVLEHRRTGSANAAPLAARVREGRRLYSLGYSLTFFCLRCVYRSLSRPRIVGSGAALFGFLQGAFGRHPIVLPPDVVRFLRAEQRRKIVRRLMTPPERARSR